MLWIKWTQEIGSSHMEVDAIYGNAYLISLAFTSTYLRV